VRIHTPDVRRYNACPVIFAVDVLFKTFSLSASK